MKISLSNCLGSSRILGPGLPTMSATIVFPLVGQSNSVGWATYDGNGDYPVGVQEYNQSNQLVQASSPLDHLDEPAGSMGLQITFVDEYLADNPSHNVVLVPCGDGGTGFADGNWNKGDVRYEAAVSRINALMTANPTFTLGAFLWHQGEDDADNATNAANYEAALDAMIANMRTDVASASATTPFIAGGLVPSWVSGNTDRETVQAAIEGLPNRVGDTAYVDSSTLPAEPDGIHFTAAALRTFGERYYERFIALGEWDVSGVTITASPGVSTPNVTGTTIS